MVTNVTTFVPTTSETALMLAVIKNLAKKGGIQCDWASVASEVGYGTPKSAQDRWGHIRNRMAKCEQAAGTGGAGTATAAKVVKARSKPKMGGKRKRDEIACDAEEGGHYEQKPRRLVKASKKALAAAEAKEFWEAEAKVEDNNE